MGHSLNRTSISINQNLVIDDNTFNPGYILISDERGNVSWKNPSGYIDQTEPLEHFIGELYGGGIVVAVWREVKEAIYEKCLIAATRDYGEFSSPNTYFGYSWGLNTFAMGTSSRYFSFGASNSAAQGASATNANPFPAAQVALSYVNEDLYGLGVYGDWYLPSVFELNCLANNAAIVNRVIAQYASDKSIRLYDQGGLGASMSLFCNAKPTRDAGGRYWTSTEYITSQAYYLDMDGLRFGVIDKASACNVRPFRLDVKRWNGLSWVQDRNKTGKVLIVYDQPPPAYATTSPGGGMVTNITTTEVSLGNTVSVITSYSSLPADLSQYDHIWDINVQEGGAAVQTYLVPTGAAAKYTTYLQQGGGLFILGENAQNYTPRNNDLASFITNLGGGNIQTSNQNINTSLNVESEFLIANNRNTVTFLAIGRFSSIGTGSPITRNPIDSSTGHAVVWKTGSLSSAPKGAIVVVLDFNFLSSNYGSLSPYYSQEFVANISQILNKS